MSVDERRSDSSRRYDGVDRQSTYYLPTAHYRSLRERITRAVELVRTTHAVVFVESSNVTAPAAALATVDGFTRRCLASRQPLCFRIEPVNARRADVIFATEKWWQRAWRQQLLDERFERPSAAASS